MQQQLHPAAQLNHLAPTSLQLLRRKGLPCRTVLALQEQESSSSSTAVDHAFPVHVATTLPQIIRRTALSFSELHPRHLLASSSGGSVVSTLCNVADSLIGAFLGPQTLHPNNDPDVQLSGNYAPVPECAPQRCLDIAGTLPADLNGIYIRNGPNVTHLFEREGYHMFDGDGMLHGVRLRAGKASYCSRYVRTSRFVQEEIAGRPLFLKFFGGFYGFIGFARAGLVLVRAVLGVLNMSEGWGLSNTSVSYFNGRVLSLSEDDMPYVIRVTGEGDLITLGRLQFSQGAGAGAGAGGGPPTRNMCAHPKFDASTGEMFAFSFRPSLKYPYSFYKVSSSGLKSRDVTIPFKDIPFIHDFALTEHYAIFPQSQFVIQPLKFIYGQMPVVCDKRRTAKLCVVRRDATESESGLSQPIWFDVPGCNAYHYINAWEEGDEIVLITPVLSPPETFLNIPAQGTECHVTEIRLNLTDGSTTTTKLCNENLEFGTFNLNYTGRKIRYAYLALGSYPEISGIVKVDLEQQGKGELCIVARRDFPKNCHGNEPFFVPKADLQGGEPGAVTTKHSVNYYNTRTENKNAAGSSSGNSKSSGSFSKNYMMYSDSSSSSSEGCGAGGRIGLEDDGYLLCLVHDQSRGSSHLLVMDPQSSSLDILASVKLPSRVPYGFHGFFINERRLAQQAT